jgi:RHS repeat-associated protein
MKKTKTMSRSMKDAVHIAGALALSLASFTQAAAQTSTITNTVSYVYDTLGRATKTIVEPDNPLLRVETADTYTNGLKRQSIVSSPATGVAAIAPRTTLTGYGTSVTQTDAMGLQTITKVNYNFYRRTEVKTPDGAITAQSLDGFGRPLKQVRADSSEIRISHLYCAGVSTGTATCPALAAYFTEAQVFGAADVVPPIGPRERKYFDALDRLIRTETQGFDGVSDIRVDNEYDSLGRLYRTSRPYYRGQSIYWMTYEYDALNRVRKITAPDGSTVVTERSGLATTVTNALNQSKTTTVNSDGQLVQVKDAQNNVLTYSYDANGKLVKTVDPIGNTIQMTYDILGRQLSQIDPDRGTTTYEYDVLGQLIRQTDTRGKVTNFNYDLIGRIIARSEEDLNTTWEYDQKSRGTCALNLMGQRGKLCRVITDNGYVRNFYYDAVGRVRFENYELDGWGEVRPTYDATTKRLATVSYGSTFTLKYIYTPLGYLKEIRDNTSGALYWRADAMDAEGHLTQQTYGNNISTQNVFDPATGRLKNIYGGPGNAVQDMSFEYDRLGNMLWRIDATQSLSETFEYDSLSRLTANTVNSPQAALQTQSYSYDSIGNITSRSDTGTYAYGTNGAGPHAVSQITQAGGVVRQLNYDAIGSMVLDQTRDAAGATIAAKTRSISYTSFGMPSTITANGTSATFLYGPDHQRIKQITPTGNTIYIHPDNAGGLGYERETRADGTVEHRYFVSANGIPVALIKKLATTANPAVTATTTSYLHRDHLGSTAVVTDAAAAVVERMAYEPFGKRRQPAGPVDANNQLTGVVTDRGFTTHEHLDELGLIHMNGRVYDPLIARFVSADPTNVNPDDIESYNRYSYVHNNPLAATDPSGYVRCLAGLMGDASRCGAPLSNIFEGMSSFVASGFEFLTIKGNGPAFAPTKTFVDNIATGTAYNGDQVVKHTGTWKEENTRVYGTADQVMGQWVKFNPIEQIALDMGASSNVAAGVGIAATLGNPKQLFGNKITTIAARELTAADLGVLGKLDELKGTIQTVGNELHISIDMIAGRVTNQFQVMSHLKSLGVALGADAVVINATIAESKLYRFMERAGAQVANGVNGYSDQFIFSLGFK